MATDTTQPADLDRLLTPTEAAKWLRLSRRVLLANIRRGTIPVVRINDRVLRVHPATVIRARSTIMA